MHSQNKQTWIRTLLFFQPEEPGASRARTAFLSSLLFSLHVTTRGRLVITYRSLPNFTFPYSGECFLFSLGEQQDHGVDV